MGALRCAFLSCAAEGEGRAAEGEGCAAEGEGRAAEREGRAAAGKDSAAEIGDTRIGILENLSLRDTAVCTTLRNL